MGFAQPPRSVARAGTVERFVSHRSRSRGTVERFVAYRSRSRGSVERFHFYAPGRSWNRSTVLKSSKQAARQPSNGSPRHGWPLRATVERFVRQRFRCFQTVERFGSANEGTRGNPRRVPLGSFLCASEPRWRVLRVRSFVGRPWDGSIGTRSSKPNRPRLPGPTSKVAQLPPVSR